MREGGKRNKMIKSFRRNSPLSGMFSVGYVNIFSCVPAMSSIIPDIGAREGGRHRRNMVETFFFLDPSSLLFFFFLFFSSPTHPHRQDETAAPPKEDQLFQSLSIGGGMDREGERGSFPRSLTLARL